ncbi:MAG: type II toxin-antitoxin system Phd/YefM family antitoxin [Deltaproteobacteria bacterium]|nr:type II toxin-antitoxin system Phd/YefM family antitoxin [Deltaproteobacteria bacterium]
MKLARDIRPITYMKTRAAELVESVAGEGRTVVITQGGRARAVVIGVETYEAWQEALALLKLLTQGEADVACGRVVPQGKAFERARRRLRARG